MKAASGILIAIIALAGCAGDEEPRGSEEPSSIFDERGAGPIEPEDHIRFMLRLERESIMPPAGSNFVGKWGETRSSNPELELEQDGTLVWSYDGETGHGTWRQHPEGIIWMLIMGFKSHPNGRERVWCATSSCHLDEDDKLVQDHFSVADYYVRTAPAGTSEEAGGD